MLLHDDFDRSSADAMEFVMRHYMDVDQDSHINVDEWYFFYDTCATEWSAGGTRPTTVEACMLITASNFDTKVTSLCIFKIYWYIST